MKKVKDYVSLIRVKHWIKNGLIALPIVCANAITSTNIINVLLGILSFSFAASFIYIINDIRDIEKDKLHPRKKKRPLPSGKISKLSACILSVFMLIFSLLFNYIAMNSILNIPLAFLLVYIILNILYSCGLKNQAIIDVAILASGFVLRVYYGAAIIDVAVSDWLFLTILSASLFLGVGKRRKEYLNAPNSRKVLKEYEENYLNHFQYLSLTLLFVFYSLWAMEQNIEGLVFTVPVIILIFMKYCLIIEKSDEGDPITIIYNDKLLLLLCFIYVIVMGILLLGLL